MGLFFFSETTVIAKIYTVVVAIRQLQEDSVVVFCEAAVN
jgi:hypothetical protein